MEYSKYVTWMVTLAVHFFYPSEESKLELKDGFIKIFTSNQNSTQILNFGINFSSRIHVVISGVFLYIYTPPPPKEQMCIVILCNVFDMFEHKKRLLFMLKRKRFSIP